MTECLYERLLSALRAADWQVCDWHSERLCTGHPREVTIDRNAGTARLRVEPLADDRLRLVLTNSLDPTLPATHDGFEGELAAAHRRTASSLAHEGPIEVVADGRVVATAELSTDDHRVERVVETIDKIAAATDELHDRLRGVVRDWPPTDL